MFLHYCIKMHFIWAGKTSLTLKIIKIFGMANNARQIFFQTFCLMRKFRRMGYWLLTRDIRWQFRTKNHISHKIDETKQTKKNVHRGFSRRLLINHHSWGKLMLSLIVYFLVYELSTCIHIFIGGGCKKTVLGQWFLVHRQREWMQPTTKRNLYISSRSIRSLRCASGKIYLYILLYKSQQDAHVTEFILSDTCFTCFGRYCHPSSGAQTTVTIASGNLYTVLLSAALVEDLELIWVCCGLSIRHPQHTQISSNSSTIAADNNTV
jgi:hypothetical protein